MCVHTRVGLCRLPSDLLLHCLPLGLQTSWRSSFCSRRRDRSVDLRTFVVTVANELAPLVRYEIRGPGHLLGRLRQTSTGCSRVPCCRGSGSLPDCQLPQRIRARSTPRVRACCCVSWPVTCRVWIRPSMLCCRLGPNRRVGCGFGRMCMASWGQCVGGL